MMLLLVSTTLITKKIDSWGSSSSQDDDIKNGTKGEAVSRDNVPATHTARTEISTLGRCDVNYAMFKERFFRTVFADDNHGGFLALPLPV
jgi:hypothetical protein